LIHFPRLQQKLADAQNTTSARGSLTISKKLRSVFVGNVALIGEASGSVDAITGEGLAMAFRQSLALAEAIAVSDLRQYARAHRRIAKLPDFMSRAMLLMDKSDWLQSRAFTAFRRRPSLFARMLSVHVGAAQLTSFGQYGMANLAWQLFTS
jgi:flavin-dependent dehydrogenase